MYPIRQLKLIQFSVFDPQSIRGSSAIEGEGINRAEYRINGQYVKGGINDPALGTIDKFVKCITCGGDLETCPGHFGHIELAEPMYHIGFIGYVYRVLQCICFKCARLRDDFNDEKQASLKKQILMLNGEKRLDRIFRELKDKKKCKHEECNEYQPKFSKRGFIIEIERILSNDGDKGKKEQYFAKDAIELLKRMREEDIEFLGFNTKYTRPEWLILTTFPVPPLHIRPSVFLPGSSSKSEDDLTYKLSDILKANLDLKASVYILLINRQEKHQIKEKKK